MFTKQRIVFSTIISLQIFFTILLFIMMYSDSSYKTIQKTLPIPYSAFENLYFDARENRFLALGNDIDPDLAIAKIEGRTLAFNALEKLPEGSKVNKVISDTTVIMLEFPLTAGYCKHFFHLLEHLVGLWSFDSAEHHQDVKLVVLPYEGEFDKGPNEINKHVLTAMYPNARIVDWRTFLNENYDGLVRFERAVISDRSLTKFSYECQKINKHLGAALPFLSPKALDSLSEAVNKYANTQVTKKDKLAVTFIKRPMPRTLEPALEEKFLKAIAEIPGIELTVSDFAKIPFKEQVNIVGNTDLFISVHGNGLSHILFLPAHAAVVEISPPQALCLDYMLFANARNLDFLELSASDGIITRDQAYAAGTFGNMGATIYEMNYDPIITFIKQHIK